MKNVNKVLSKGLLIALEGIDGSGKTTLARTLSAVLQAEGYPVILTREPGGTELGKNIRAVVQHSPVRPQPKSEFLLFAADRAHHIETLVKPALAQKKIVISDRMSDSSLAYQGYGRGVDIDMIEQINRWAMDGIQPDITIYVKVDPQTAHERTAHRGELSNFEQEKRDFFERVVRGFEVIFHNRKDVLVIDGLQSPEKVAAQTFAKLMPLLTAYEVSV
jgi:dTMP kinase